MIEERLCLLKVEQLCVEYDSPSGEKIKAVDEVFLELMPGETIGIIGESGCGKSTLVMSILNLIERSEGKISKGKVCYRGSDLLKLDPGSLRELRGNNISLVIQDPYSAFNPVISIGKQLKEAFCAHNPKNEEKFRKRILYLFEVLGLETDRSFLENYPHQLSGGMLQRVNIAAALINEPEIMLADEPTSNLDVTIQKKIIELLQKLKNEKRFSMIFVTHNLNLIAGIADRVYIMKKGKVLEYGPTESIFLKPQHIYTRELMSSILSRTNKKYDSVYKKIDCKGSTSDPAWYEVENGHYCRRI